MDGGLFDSAQNFNPTPLRVRHSGQADRRRPISFTPRPRQQRSSIVNRIIWLVGAVVIILFVLGYLGMR